MSDPRTMYPTLVCRRECDFFAQAPAVDGERDGAASIYRQLTGFMADTTTVAVQTSTRVLFLQIVAARRQSADQVILAALEAMQHDERRRVAAAEAPAIKDDPAGLAEIRAPQQEMAAPHEG